MSSAVDRPCLKRCLGYDASNYNEYSAPNSKIMDTVLGSQLLNACKNGNRDEAREALSKIEHYSSLMVKDPSRSTALFIASSNNMVDIVCLIIRKIISFNNNINEKHDSTVLAEIRSRFGSLLKAPENSLEQSDKISNFVFGLKLLNACKNRNMDDVVSALSKITSYSSLIIEDDNRQTAVSYSIANGMMDVAEFLKNKIEARTGLEQL